MIIRIINIILDAFSKILEVIAEAVESIFVNASSQKNVKNGSSVIKKGDFTFIGPFYAWYNDTVVIVHKSSKGSVDICESCSQDKEDKVRWLCRLYVEEKSRGKGIGSGLVKAALYWCKNNGIKTVFLWCKKGKMSFYERLGFESTGISSEDQGVTDQEEDEDALLYKMKLNI